jgi:hypothetical protein
MLCLGVSAYISSVMGIIVSFCIGLYLHAYVVFACPFNRAYHSKLRFRT